MRDTPWEFPNYYFLLFASNCWHLHVYTPPIIPVNQSQWAVCPAVLFSPSLTIWSRIRNGCNTRLQSHVVHMVKVHFTNWNIQQQPIKETKHTVFLTHHAYAIPHSSSVIYTHKSKPNNQKVLIQKHSSHICEYKKHSSHICESKKHSSHICYTDIN